MSSFSCTAITCIVLVGFVSASSDNSEWNEIGFPLSTEVVKLCTNELYFTFQIVYYF